MFNKRIEKWMISTPLDDSEFDYKKEKWMKYVDIVKACVEIYLILQL